ncbi:hypothetical protein [Variovorax soli]|uniref:Uncharacterized protein n=1 Tax=Variovorax soli TaxID=376815 RepID=A0ABU1NN83_9BURK|nr:hypothetical protein [Variovorax soli]MDR6539486.1 hypothetical protein [Variovorax soli]
MSAISRIMDGAVQGRPISASWCRDSASLSSDLFAVRDYKLLDVGKKKSDTPISTGEYVQHYSIRVESSNRGGMPIVKDWGFLMKYGDLNLGGIGWCVAYII